ncbi:hypothetical protein OAH12_02520 [Cyclobacteriaceae bacterium]|nr:hypothetical protein [Cyclobacteriaceae bacterium]
MGGPIEGELDYGAQLLTPLLDYLNPGDSIRFEVYILDRDLNRSNTIITTPIVLGDGPIIQ